MTLLDAKKNKHYTVLHVTSSHSLRRRLFDLGFVAGTRLYFACRAPLSQSVLVRIRGVFIALRFDAAQLIIVAECK